MSELERLVILMLEASGVALTDEMAALKETINARCESARGYDKTRRGVHALERSKARTEEREPDYVGALKNATLKPGEL